MLYYQKAKGKAYHQAEIDEAKTLQRVAPKILKGKGYRHKESVEYGIEEGHVDHDDGYDWIWKEREGISS